MTAKSYFCCLPWLAYKSNMTEIPAGWPDRWPHQHELTLCASTNSIQSHSLSRATPCASSDGADSSTPTARQAAAMDELGQLLAGRPSGSRREIAAIAQANNGLGWALLRKLHDEHKTSSATISPLSLTMAIGMLAGASDVATKRVLARKLGLRANAPVHDILCLNGSHAGRQLAIANTLIAQESVPLSKDYIDFLKAFDAPLARYPSLPGAVGAINAWISDHTLHLVRDMVTATTLASIDILIINAIAFKGTWEDPFNRRETKIHPFHISDNQAAPAQMMFRHNARIATLRTAEFVAVCLPYTSDGTSPASLIAYLPNMGIALRNALDAVSHTSPRFTDVWYQRFGFPKFELRCNFSVLETLTELGYPVDGVKLVPVGKVLHQAVVKVDEEGTTAAAATALEAPIGVAPAMQPELIFDRPFAFSIVSDKTNVVLFAGLYCGLDSVAT